MVEIIRNVELAVFFFRDLRTGSRLILVLSSIVELLLTPLLFCERLSSVGMGLRSRVSVMSQVNADEWALFIRGASEFVLIKYKSQRLRSRLGSRGSLKMYYDVVF